MIIMIDRNVNDIIFSLSTDDDDEYGNDEEYQDDDDNDNDNEEDYHNDIYTVQELSEP